MAEGSRADVAGGRALRICIVYDCLYPWNVGGAERWYRRLAEAAVAQGHHVTYLTRRVWPAGQPPLSGIEVVGVSPGGRLYTDAGRRRIVPPLRFGWGVFWHLVRRRRAYDVVHGCSFPFFSLVAIRAALIGRPVAVGVDWFEVWSGAYWRSYLGRIGGAVGSLVQGACARLTPLAIAYSDLSEGRLRDQGVAEVVRPGGLHAGRRDHEPCLDAPATPRVVYFGRHIPDKRVHLLPAAVAIARRELPDLSASIYGAGPGSDEIRVEIDRWGVADAIDMPGFVDEEAVGPSMAAATCLVNLSSREGYGLVVVEASSHGTPVVVVAGEDNAAAELVDEGVNGFVVSEPDPAAIASAIVRAHRGGAALRASTAAWYLDNAPRLDAARSIDLLLDRYRVALGA